LRGDTELADPAARGRAIGGVEVGVVGGFAAVVADADAFVKLTPP
jgi:hypothetical protein